MHTATNPRPSKMSSRAFLINPIEFQRRVRDWVSIGFVGEPIIEYDNEADGDTLHFSIYCENKLGVRTCPLKQPNCLDHARAILGPSVKIVFGKQIELYATNPTEDQSNEIAQAVRKVALILSQRVWPLWLAKTFLVISFLSTLASIYFLHSHLHEYEVDGALHTMFDAASATALYYIKAFGTILGFDGGGGTLSAET